MEVPRHLARVPFEHLLDGRGRGGLLLEQNLPGDRLDLGIRELDGNAEAVAEPLQRLRPGRQRRLSRRDEKHPASKPGLDGLRQVGDRGRPVPHFVDVLLHLVEHQNRERNFSIRGKRLLGGRDELVVCDVGLRRWELVEQELPGRLDVRSEGRIRGDECLRDDWAHIEVVEFPIPTPALGLDSFPHPAKQPVVPQPEAEPGLGVLLGEPARPKQDGQHRQPHMADIAPEEGPRSGHQWLADPPPPHLELPQRVLYLRRQSACHETPRRGSVVELRVDPKVRQHLEQVRLAAAEEPAHPHGILPGPVQVSKVPLQNSLECVGEPAPADEGLQFVAQLAHDLRVLSAGNPGLAVVGQPDLQRVAIEKFVDSHGGFYGIQASWRVIGCAR